jgi:hypothetical protein
VMNVWTRAAKYRIIKSIPNEEGRVKMDVPDGCLIAIGQIIHLGIAAYGVVWNL